MSKTIKPDKKLFTKNLYILLTITGSVLILPAIVHLIIYLVGEDPIVAKVIWLVCLIILIVGWIISVPLIKLWINNLAYIIREDRVTIHKGFLTKTQQNIPYRSITDFALVRSIFDRLLGIGSIKIQTAGQTKSPSGYEGHLAGLIDFEELHKELREKIKFLHPVSESLTTNEVIQKSHESIWDQILSELKTIRKLLEKQ